MKIEELPAPDLVPPGSGAAIERFAQALRQAMVIHRWSERRLASEMGITVGTTQKYFRGKVHPLRVSTGINSKLACLLGISLDKLVHFYETGEYEASRVAGFDEVLSWLRSEAGVEHLVPLLQALADAGGKARATACVEGEQEVKPEPPPRYDWPLEELRETEISDALRRRMGLSDGALERLATTGEFDDELVEAFSVATNLEEASVREAFTRRVSVHVL